MISVICLAIVICTALAAGAQETESPMNAEPMPTPMMLGVPPYVSLQALPAYGVAPLTVGFFVNGEDPENADFVAYHWNFGDGHVSTLPPILVYETYTQPGSYVVTLTAVTADGRSASALAGITVRPAPSQ